MSSVVQVDSRCTASPYNDACLGVASWKGGSFLALLFGLFQPLDVMTQFERWAQFKSHVLHNDITA